MSLYKLLKSGLFLRQLSQRAGKKDIFILFSPEAGCMVPFAWAQTPARQTGEASSQLCPVAMFTPRTNP